MNKEELWQFVLTQIQLATSPANFATWFKNTEIIDIDKDLAIISVPSNFSKEWLEKKYGKLILKILRDLNDSVKKIEFKVAPAGQMKPSREKTIQVSPDQLKFEDFCLDKETNLNPKYTFSNFIVGPFNELAQAAAWAISENPGTMYNPFFIYGGVGLGKTHLVQAIGNKIISTFPEKKIRYATTERFTTEVINSIRNQSIEKLKENYRKFDVLIIDDIQFLAGKEKTQEEFFHLFNALYEGNKQIIISSDRPPQAISALEERLRSRFEGGMIADVGSPDLESRIAILKQKVQEKNLNIDNDVLEYIAQNVQNNIRQLEGTLNRLAAFQKLGTKTLDSETAKKLLRKIIQPEQKKASYQKVIQFVAEFYDMNPKDLFQNSRKKEIVRPRQIAMYFLRKEINYSFPYIGKKFGGKDHTTAIYAFEKVSHEIEINENLAQEISVIREKLYN
jgi:chromosomal replication initiator protein